MIRQIIWLPMDKDGKYEIPEGAEDGRCVQVETIERTEKSNFGEVKAVQSFALWDCEVLGENIPLEKEEPKQEEKKPVIARRK